MSHSVLNEPVVGSHVCFPYHDIGKQNVGADLDLNSGIKI